jgi:hypothetical protein
VSKSCTANETRNLARVALYGIISWKLMQCTESPYPATYYGFHPQTFSASSVGRSPQEEAGDLELKPWVIDDHVEWH